MSCAISVEAWPQVWCAALQHQPRQFVHHVLAQLFWLRCFCSVVLAHLFLLTCSCSVVFAQVFLTTSMLSCSRLRTFLVSVYPDQTGQSGAGRTCFLCTGHTLHDNLMAVFHNIQMANNQLVLQALSASAAALIGIAQLLVPAVSFFKDMWPHTAGFGRNWIVLAIYVNCSILVVAWTLFPNLFATSHGAVWDAFPFNFRWQFLVLIVSTNILAIFLSNIRRCLQSRCWGHASNAVFPLNH